MISSERVLIVRRGKPPLEGQWSIPGGALELGETVEEGVRREIAEETGLEVLVLDRVEIFESISRAADGRVLYHFVILDYLCTILGGEARAGSDASEVAWVAEPDLSRYTLTAGAVPVIRKAFEMSRRRESLRS